MFGEVGNVFNGGAGGPGPAAGRGSPPPAGVKRLRLSDCTDGTVNTIFLVESNDPEPWAKPGTDLPFDPNNPLKLSGPTPGMILVAMASADVMPLSSEMKPSLVKKLIVRNDGDLVSNEEKSFSPTWNLKDPKERDELAKEIDSLTEQWTELMPQLLKAMEELRQIDNRNAKLKGKEFTPALAARVIALEKEVQQMKENLAGMKKKANQMMGRPD